SVPDVALRDVEPVKALRDGWQTSIANLVPLLVLAGALILVVLLASALLVNLGSGLATGALMSVLIHPWLAASMWVADRDRRRDDGAGRLSVRIDGQCEGSCASRRRTIGRAAMMPSSYSRHIGTASITCESTSGGVTMAPTTKAPTIT